MIIRSNTEELDWMDELKDVFFFSCTRMKR